MSYSSTSQRNLSSSQPNLTSSSSPSSPSSSSSSSLEKKAWFIGKFLCRNLDGPTYAKISEQICELKALKTKVKLNSRGWKVGGRMDWSSPVSFESIPLQSIHDLSQDVTFASALLVVLQFDRVANDSMYEILAYKFKSASTAVAFQTLFRRLTGTKDSMMRTLSRTNVSLHTLTPLAPGIHHGGWNRGMVDGRGPSSVGSYYKYQGQNKKTSISDLDSLDNNAIYREQETWNNNNNNYNNNINNNNSNNIRMVGSGSILQNNPRQEFIDQDDTIWNQGEAKLYVGATNNQHNVNRGPDDVKRGIMSSYEGKSVDQMGGNRGYGGGHGGGGHGYGGGGHGDGGGHGGGHGYGGHGDAGHGGGHGDGGGHGYGGGGHGGVYSGGYGGGHGGVYSGGHGGGYGGGYGGSEMLHRAPSVQSGFGGSSSSYYSQQQHRYLQVPRIGSKSDTDNSSLTSQTGVYLLNPKFKRTYVSRNVEGGGATGSGHNVGGGHNGGGHNGALGHNGDGHNSALGHNGGGHNGGYNIVASPYPQQETKFM